MDYRIKKQTLSGSLSLPTSKSQTMRALVFALLAKGTSKIESPLDSPDTDKMIEAITSLGAKVEHEGSTLYVTGTAGVLTAPSAEIDTGGSGLVYRFITALISLAKEDYTITDNSLGVTNRVITPLLGALQGAGHEIVFLNEAGKPPFRVSGTANKVHYRAEGKDSQITSSLLILAAFRGEAVSLTIDNPGEIPFVKMTLAWLNELGIEVEHSEDFTSFCVHRKKVVEAFSYRVPADYSSLMYPLGMALVSNSALRVDHIDLSDSQGDKIIIEKLKAMGAKLHVDKDKHQLHIGKSPLLKGLTIDMSECIDAISFFAVLGCFITSGTMRLINASVARNKECDRISATYKELKKMGANIEEHEDGLTIYPSKLKSSKIECYGDHRMVLSFSVAAFSLESASHIDNASCIEKTYRHFARDMNRLGANIEVIR